MNKKGIGIVLLVLGAIMSAISYINYETSLIGVSVFLIVLGGAMSIIGHGESNYTREKEVSKSFFDDEEEGEK